MLGVSWPASIELCESLKVGEVIFWSLHGEADL